LTGISPAIEAAALCPGIVASVTPRLVQHAVIVIVKPRTRNFSVNSSFQRENTIRKLAYNSPESAKIEIESHKKACPERQAFSIDSKDFTGNSIIFNTLRG
jgi:hypothetical protein